MSEDDMIQMKMVELIVIMIDQLVPGKDLGTYLS